eukprot:TRINITY_DN18054_c0_g1_i1.p1 TRINITY_DN18054_c0_g1~~TRINITY_DN18054_c0_g1_i1.p1  ORF type:complete len:129 (-),score=8.59 TRINITY_DN18054_c0_g1_i1:76-462(-)
MDHYKAYGIKFPKLDSFGSEFTEYRMIVLVFGFSLALLFANPALIAWGVLFFLVGFAAEFTGKVAMKVGLGLSALLALSSLAFIGSGFWLSNLVFAAVTGCLSVDGLRKNVKIKQIQMEGKDVCNTVQ